MGKLKGEQHRVITVPQNCRTSAPPPVFDLMVLYLSFFVTSHMHIQINTMFNQCVSVVGHGRAAVWRKE